MKTNPSLSVVLTVGIGVFVALPITVAAYAGSHVASVSLPVFHSQAEAQNVALTPISVQKAQAIHDFKLQQI